MRRLETLDRVLLATLLPVFAVVFALHVREAYRTGLAQPPVFAVPGEGAYPVVGGLRLERGADWSGLEPGDVLLRIGERDLRGVGHVGFEAVALEQAGREGVAPLVYVRDGTRHTMDLAMRRHDMPWYRLPFLFGFVGVALLVLLRAPGTTQSRLFFAAFLGLAILETPFMGGPYLQTRAHYAVFHAFGPVAVGLLLAWMTRFPEQVPDRRRLSPWIGLVGLLFLVVRLPYFLGGPIPPHWTPSVVLLCDAFFMTTGLFVIAWNAYHADSLGRRRLKWFALGVILGVGPLLLTMIAQPFGVPPDRFRQLFQVAVLFVVLVPVGILIGILRSGLFDIDRLLSSTAAYSLALVTVLGAGLALAPDLVASLASATGLARGVVGPLAALAVAGAVVPLGRRLRPHLDRIFFPERVVRERGLQRLLRDLSDCDAPDELLALLGERLEALLRLEGVRVLVAGEEALAPADAPAPRLPRRGALARALERDPVPLVVDERSLARLAPEPAPAERAQLDALRARVLLPVRRGKDLAAVVALGPKRSGDLFPPTELTLLGALAEKASAELLRLRDAQALESERTRAEALQRLHRETEAAMRARSRFLAAASHDLRQPLHALGLFAERLAARPADGETASLARHIRSSVASLATQFDALLDVSRLDTGTVVAEPRAFALRPELASLASELEEAARARGLALRFEAEDLVVHSDPVLLRRIVQNLLANAVRYTQQGEVRLRARSLGDEACIEVIDTGPGIPPERQREVFGEFVRLGGGGDDGLGLGLSIVERTAALLGHRVELDSAPGRGSTFRVRLPCAGRAAAAAAPPPPRISLATPFAERVVVLVEDDLRVLEATRGLLESWGCRVLLADSTRAAVEALRRSGRAPEVIVADYQLGDEDTGLAAIRAIRALAGADVPAVVVSGESRVDGREELRSSGLPLLPKPVPPAKLRALLTEMLRGSADAVRH